MSKNTTPTKSWSPRIALLFEIKFLWLQATASHQAMALSWHLAGEAQRYFADTSDIAHGFRPEFGTYRYQ
jgi:hypothetical protein